MNFTASRKVDEYIEALSQDKQNLANKIRKMLFASVPEIEERFSFRLPFYHYYAMFCYLHANKNGLNLCICRGKDLLEVFPQLEQKARASIASVLLCKPGDLLRLEVPTIIAAAAVWNKEASLRKISILQKKNK